MSDRELRQRLDVAERKRDRLRAELVDLAAQLPSVRAQFGNPFFYSHPSEADEGEANYTAYSSHEVTLPTVLELLRVEREIQALNHELEEATRE